VSDIKGSSFAEGMKRFFRQRNEIKVFNLEGGLSTYIKSLRELRAINVVTGTVDHLMNLLESNKFARIEEDDSTVLLHDASLIIRRNPASTPESADNAPDHLARLFAYNNIMRQVGPGYFNEDFVNDALVGEASTAYVVSPVSSLIVLETVADYQRFGIRDEGDSLFNASKQSTGAVPEPHEWALIILFVLFVIYVRIRN
jgi:XrtN system VIT domain protein